MNLRPIEERGVHVGRREVRVRRSRERGLSNFSNRWEGIVKFPIPLSGLRRWKINLGTDKMRRGSNLNNVLFRAGQLVLGGHFVVDGSGRDPCGIRRTKPLCEQAGGFLKKLEKPNTKKTM